jgi:hypothetical protein
LISPTPVGVMGGSHTPLQFGDATMRGVIVVGAADPTIEVICSGSTGGVGEGSWATFDVAVTAAPVQSWTDEGVRLSSRALPERRIVNIKNLFSLPPGRSHGGRHAGSR